MQLELSTTIDHPRDAVLIAIRDRIDEVAHFMPDVEGVAILARDEAPGVVRMTYRWEGARRSIPLVLRPFISRNLLGIDDKAEWYTDEAKCHWRIEPRIAARCLRCQGTTLLTDEPGGGTRMVLQIELEIDPAEIPGVPRVIGLRLKGPLERYVARSLTPNLSRLSAAVQQFLDAEALPANGAACRRDPQP